MSDNDAAQDGTPSVDSLACIACRNRKLKCDRCKPACLRCKKLNVDCVYPESRRKPTFKRRNVKELEARLAQVEDLLREVGGGRDSADIAEDNDAIVEQVHLDFDYARMPAIEDVFLQGLDYTPPDQLPKPDAGPQTLPWEVPRQDSDKSASSNDQFTGQLMGLGGLSEALPPFEVMEELNRMFFERQQHFIPILHPARYIQSFYSAPHMRPPMCLQYAIWALASNGDAKYHSYHEVFYQRARQYLEADEMKGYGEHFITLAHAQAWCLVATDEAKSMFFTRAAMSSARATQLAHMMGLHRLDFDTEDTSPTLAPSKDWAELEERRRTFWGIFCIDSHCSISTGWPHLIDVAEAVTTRLPASETAFLSGQKTTSPTLHEALQGAVYASFAGAVIVCHLFNLVNTHVHRGKPSDNAGNYEYGKFWNRHREIDNILSGAFMFLPPTCRLPENNRDPTAIHTNLNLHAAVICLHHGAIDQIEKHKLSDDIRKISEDRLSCAAQEIVNIAKLTSHISNKMKSPLAALSLYCAASVYIYFAKSRNEPYQVGNLDFLLSAMEAVAREHSITRAFLRQVILDIQNNGIASIIRLPKVDTLSAKFGKIPPNSIPMLARSQISRHSAIAPPLPGRLPLGNPVGCVTTSKMSDFQDGVPVSHGFVPVGDDNDAMQTSDQSQAQQESNTRGAGSAKRRRTSPSAKSNSEHDAETPYMLKSWSTRNDSGDMGISSSENLTTPIEQVDNRYTASAPSRQPDIQPFHPGDHSAPLNSMSLMHLPHRTGSPFTSTGSSPHSNPAVASASCQPSQMIPPAYLQTKFNGSTTYSQLVPEPPNLVMSGAYMSTQIQSSQGGGTFSTTAAVQASYPNPITDLNAREAPWEMPNLGMGNPNLDWAALAAAWGMDPRNTSDVNEVGNENVQGNVNVNEPENHGEM